jgi:hypothetical protein
MYRNTKSTLAIAGLATAVMVGVATSAAAQAPDTDERTKITIDEPVEIPGATLQPGSYWFEQIGSDAYRHTIVVQNESENKTIATVFAVPIYRELEDTKGGTELTFVPTAGSGSTAALKAWFFPGRQYGHEFIYPKDQAQQIAQSHKQVVLAESDGKVVRLNPEGVAEPWAPDSKSSDRAMARTDNAAPKADDDRNPAAVGTSGMADAASMSAEDHLEALSTMIDKALAGNGSNLTIDRATLQQMKSHIDALQKQHEK